jgi:hypothetical protein
LLFARIATTFCSSARMIPPLVAVVHLTYASRPEQDPRWPEMTLFDSMQDWIERGMKADHDDFFLE